MNRTALRHQPAAALRRLALLAICAAAPAAHAAAPPGFEGVDLEITRFRATTKVDLSSRNGSDIHIELAVRNNGSLDAPRWATLVGRTIPGANLVFHEQFEVGDDPRGGPTAYSISTARFNFVPEPGGIRWEISIADDVVTDDDTATDITVVNP